MSGGGCASLTRCPAGGRCPAGAAAPLRRRAALPPRCRLPALGRPARMQAGRGSERGCDGAGARGGLWGRTRLRHPPPARPPPPLTRVCGAAAASRQGNMTALHCAVFNGRAPCVESLLKAGADASLADTVSYGAERGLRSEAWGVGARSGAERGSGPAQRRVAFPRRLAPSPQTGCHHTSLLPPPATVAGWQDGVGRRQGVPPHGDHHAPGEVRPCQPRSAGKSRAAT